MRKSHLQKGLHLSMFISAWRHEGGKAGATTATLLNLQSTATLCASFKYGSPSIPQTLACRALNTTNTAPHTQVDDVPKLIWNTCTLAEEPCPCAWRTIRLQTTTTSLVVFAFVVVVVVFVLGTFIVVVVVFVLGMGGLPQGRQRAL